MDTGMKITSSLLFIARKQKLAGYSLSTLSISSTVKQEYSHLQFLFKTLYPKVLFFMPFCQRENLLKRSFAVPLDLQAQIKTCRSKIYVENQVLLLRSSRILLYCNNTFI